MSCDPSGLMLGSEWFFGTISGGLRGRWPKGPGTQPFGVGFQSETVLRGYFWRDGRSWLKGPREDCPSGQLPQPDTTLRGREWRAGRPLVARLGNMFLRKLVSPGDVLRDESGGSGGRLPPPRHNLNLGRLVARLTPKGLVAARKVGFDSPTGRRHSRTTT